MVMLEGEMVGAIIAVFFCTILLTVLIIGEAALVKKFIAESMRELMTAVFNQEAIKSKCEEAAKNGQKYVDISEVVK